MYDDECLKMLFLEFVEAPRIGAAATFGRTRLAALWPDDKSYGTMVGRDPQQPRPSVRPNNGAAQPPRRQHHGESSQLLISSLIYPSETFIQSLLHDDLLLAAVYDFGCHCALPRIALHLPFSFTHHRAVAQSGTHNKRRNDSPSRHATFLAQIDY